MNLHNIGVSNDNTITTDMQLHLFTLKISLQILYRHQS